MIRYETSTGVVLGLSRIPRQHIDNYVALNPAPEPPLVEVQVFGGVPEKIEDENDATYRAQLAAYNLRMGHAEFDLIAQALEILHPEDWRSDERTAELTSLGIYIPTQTEYLRYVALSESEDLKAVMEHVLYLSTVTQRGIEEAEQTFGVEWMGVSLEQHPNPRGNLRLSALFQARLAATDLGYTWEKFCELTGPEQSAAVAQYLCTLKVQWLSNEKQRKESENRYRSRRH